MAASLSEEEFERMQTQLLDIRTSNYVLGEKNLKIQTELLQNNKLLEDLRKELAKCQKIINRSKNAKEIEQFVQENEVLQSKLQMQEDEFRLQNETLMQEVSSLVISNENLNKELESVKVQQISSSEFAAQNDRIQLEAVNAALQKILSQSEGSSLENIEILNCEEGISEMNEALKLKILREEKTILQNNFKELQTEFKENVRTLQTENIKLREKLKKKQESFLALQEEKENLYIDSKKTFEALQEIKKTEVQQLKTQMQTMQVELQKALHFNENFIGDLKICKDVDATVELISSDKATFECSLNETKLSLAQFQEKMSLLTNQLQASEKKMQELELINTELQSKIQDLEKQKHEVEGALSEKRELAEKRKNLIDDMSNHLVEINNKHSKEIDNLIQQLSEEQTKYQKLFDKEKDTKSRLIDSRNEVQTLKDENDRLKLARNGAESKAKELEAELHKIIADCEEKINEKEKQNVEAFEISKREFELQIENLRIQVEVARAEKCEFEEKVSMLQQEAKDLIDERKIQEKKGLAMVKDLKRQLQVERNRAEKIQERLQEILNDQNRNVDEILQQSHIFDKPKGDTSSISSWSYVSGGTAEREIREGIMQSDNSSGDHDSPNRISPTLLETETNSLLEKIAQLQQKNWTLEEKVNHLERGNAALVNDVLKKTALIQFYCMEGRGEPHSAVVQDKLTIKRIVDFIKDKGDENLKEINRKMQRMLEETLTKNMELQKGIETLSNEVSRLSTISSSAENGV